MNEESDVFEYDKDIAELTKQLTSFLQLPKLLKEVITVSKNAEQLKGIFTSVQELAESVPDLTDEVENCLAEIDRDFETIKRKRSF